MLKKEFIIPRMNSAMFPKWLPLEKRNDFERRFDLAVIRYIKKWGRPPGWVGRRNILTGLCFNFARGTVGSRAHYFWLHGKYRNKCLRRKIEAEGGIFREYMRELSLKAAAKRTGSKRNVIREPRKKVQEKGWLEL